MEGRGHWISMPLFPSNYYSSTPKTEICKRTRAKEWLWLLHSQYLEGIVSLCAEGQCTIHAGWRPALGCFTSGLPAWSPHHRLAMVAAVSQAESEGALTGSRYPCGTLKSSGTQRPSCWAGRHSPHTWRSRPPETDQTLASLFSGHHACHWPPVLDSGCGHFMTPQVRSGLTGPPWRQPRCAVDDVTDVSAHAGHVLRVNCPRWGCWEPASNHPRPGPGLCLFWGLPSGFSFV